MAADPTAQVAGAAAHPTVGVCQVDQVAHVSHSSTSAADAALADASLLQQQSANSAAAPPAAASQWWRCPLSGGVMRDPVLCGGEGHSSEREALEQWLAANPGVDPLSGQPLPPGAGCDMLANHALRNMIVQLGLG